MENVMEHEIAFVQKQLSSVWPSWQITRLLGKGTYGRVYEILRNDLGNSYRCALKVLSMESEEDIPGFSPDRGASLSREDTRSRGTLSVNPSVSPSGTLSGNLSGTFSGTPTGTPSAARDPLLEARIEERTMWHSSGSGSGPDLQLSPGLLLRSISGTEINAFIRDVSSEIDLMMQLKGVPNIVTIEDYAIVREKRRCTILIRMELLDTLEAYIRSRGGAFSREDVIRLGTDICHALVFCEQKNILHRDIKISNLFYSSAAGFKLGDFGISRTMESIREKASMTGAGTIQYMAPEVYQGSPYGNTADLYSLGIVLYMLTNGLFPPLCEIMPGGAPSLTAAEVHLANMRRLQGAPLPPPQYADPALASVILCACDPLSERRFRSADAFRRALQNCLAEEGSGYDDLWGSHGDPGPDRISGSAASGGYDGRSGSLRGNNPLPGTGESGSGRGTPYPSARGNSGTREGSSQASLSPGAGGSGSGTPSPSNRLALTLLFIALFLSVGILVFLLLRRAGGQNSTGSAAAGSGDVSVSGPAEGDGQNAESDSDTDTGSGSAADSHAGADASAGVDAGSAPETDSEASPDAGADSGAGAGSEDSDVPAPEAPTTDLNVPIEWADTDLQKAVEPQVRKALGTTGSVTYFQALKVQTLSLKNCSISDISDLRHFTSLKKLDLADNYIEDISSLSDLHRLEDLNLEENMIEDVAPLAGLTDFRRLDLHMNSISDITPLRDLTGLTMLDLRENNVSDISALRDMTGMKELYLTDNSIKDISAVKNMADLEYLGLKENPVSDISAAAGKKSLKRLILGGTNVSDISIVDGLPALVYLDITGCPIPDIIPALRYDKRPDTQLVR